MKILASILLCAILGVHSYRQPKEIAQRRQVVSYTNNMVHENPNYPDQAAQSTVKVNYHTDSTDTNQQIYGTNPYAKQRQEYSHQNYQTSRPPHSQLYNVGYSVSFTGNNKQTKPPKPQKYRTSLDDGEIITGTRKHNEEVQLPPNFGASSFSGAKRQKVQAVKPKPSISTNFPNPKTLISQANLSPNTQKFYRALEQVKPQLQNTQELQQNYSWRNLSPGVEIIRSTEVPSPGQKYPRNEEAIRFDHVKALGRSQDFDSSNAVENTISAAQQQTNPFYYATRNQAAPVQVAATQNVQQLPLDATFLKEQVPIQVDTRFIDDLTRNQFVLFPNPKQANQDVNYAADQSVNYDQIYRTIPIEEASETNPVQVVYQQQQDFQPDARFQYKIYGKPQPISPFSDQTGEQIRRHPRFLGEIHTNLRPPPFEANYQRRIRLG